MNNISANQLGITGTDGVKGGDGTPLTPEQTAEIFKMINEYREEEKKSKIIGFLKRFLNKVLIFKE